ncbi:MAG: Putative symporter YjcG, partial [uncultured Solirubrobacteraceae bacterium]
DSRARAGADRLGRSARPHDRAVPELRGRHAVHHHPGQPQQRDGRGLLRGRALVHRPAERRRDRRRLHVGRVLPRHRRDHRPVRLRRLPVLDRLPRRLAHRAAARRRAPAQQRQVHDGRRAGLPHAAAPGAHGGGHLDHRRVDLLPAGPDGRRRRPRQPAARRRLPGRQEHHDRGRRRPDDLLRHGRRHEGHHLGADHQGRPADDRHDAGDHPRHGQVRRERQRSAGRRGREQRQGAGVPGARAALRHRGPGHRRQARPAVAGPRARARHRRPAAHPRPLLHRPGRQGGAEVGAVGDRDHRLVLPDDDRSGLRCGGPRRPRRDHRPEPERQHGGAAAGRGDRRRLLRRRRRHRDAGDHRGRRLRDHPRRRRGADPRELGVVRPRHLRQRPQARRGQGGRGGEGGAHRRLRDRRRLHRAVDLRAAAERGLPRRPGLRGRGVGEPAGDPLQPVLEALQHHRRRRRDLRRPRGGDLPRDLLSGRVRQAGGRPGRAEHLPVHEPGHRLLLVPARQPRPGVHPVRLLLRLARHRAVEGVQRREVRRDGGPVADRSRFREGDLAL